MSMIESFGKTANFARLVVGLRDVFSLPLPAFGAHTLWLHIHRGGIPKGERTDCDNNLWLETVAAGRFVVRTTLLAPANSAELSPITRG